MHGDEGNRAEELAYAARYLDHFQTQWRPLTLDRLALVARQAAPRDESPNAELSGDRAQSHSAPTNDQEGGPTVEAYGGSDHPWDDMLFALNALGLSQHALAHEVLPLYLNSPRLRARWASAFWLGRMRDTRALPTLVRMLTEYLPPFRVGDPDEDEIFWCAERQLSVAPLIWQMGEPRMAVALRHALLAALAVEQAIPRPSGPDLEWRMPGPAAHPELDDPRYYRPRYTGVDALQMYEGECKPWYTYQHQLVYGLGRLGAFGALMGIETPPGVYCGGWVCSGDTNDPKNWRRSNADAEEHADRFRGYLWRVQACCGYLEAEFREPLLSLAPQRFWWKSFQWFKEIPEFARAVERLLEEQFGLPDAERQLAMKDFEWAGCLSDVTLAMLEGIFMML